MVGGYTGRQTGKPQSVASSPCHCGRAADGCAGHWLRFLCRTLITSLRFLSDKAVLPCYVLEVPGSNLDTRLSGKIDVCAIYSHFVRDVALILFTNTFSSVHFIHEVYNVPGSSVGVVTSLRVHIPAVGRISSPKVQTYCGAHRATFFKSRPVVGPTESPFLSPDLLWGPSSHLFMSTGGSGPG